VIALYHCSSKHGFDFGTSNTLQLSKEVVDVCVCVCLCVCVCVGVCVGVCVEAPGDHLYIIDDCSTAQQGSC